MTVTKKRMPNKEENMPKKKETKLNKKIMTETISETINDKFQYFYFKLNNFSKIHKNS